IYPGKYVEYTEIEDIKKYAMSGSAIPNLVELFKPGDIIIGGTNFGCGSSREHAVMTLKGIGIGAILAESFARIFYRNSINLGVPAITCKAINTMFKTGEQAEMNFINGTVTNLTTGESRKFEPVGDYMMNILKHGGIKPMIKEQLNMR
ncbi:MAG: 3-isopropylmalate dehydratase small subunit, partial [Selenomonadaceae bacterium]|nr:3-isopropylmalate dehydratase small subunit [Selenomonadaceae bacterium]